MRVSHGFPTFCWHQGARSSFTFGWSSSVGSRTGSPSGEYSRTSLQRDAGLKRKDMEATNSWSAEVTGKKHGKQMKVVPWHWRPLCSSLNLWWKSHEQQRSPNSVCKERLQQKVGWRMHQKKAKSCKMPDSIKWSLSIRLSASKKLVDPTLPPKK